MTIKHNLSIWHRTLRLAIVFALIGRPVYGVSPFTYKVEAGDTLSVNIALRGSLVDLSKLSTGLSLEIVGESVYSHHEVTVTPDGYLFLPRLSPLAVRGQTLPAIETEITTQLGFPTNRNLVSVTLVKTLSMSIHVWGEVKQPGRFPFDHPISLVEAISLAGGPTEHARMKKILLIREGEPTRRFNLSNKRFMNGGYMPEMIKPGDTIIIPRQWTISEFAVFALLSALSTGSAVYVATKAR